MGCFFLNVRIYTCIAVVTSGIQWYISLALGLFEKWRCDNLSLNLS